MTSIPPPERRRLGRVEKETPLWWRRYNALRRQGFIHIEAVELATGIIGSPAMRRGRRARARWYRDALAKGMTEDEIDQAVRWMYEDVGWSSYWEQFYPEEE